MKKNLLTGLLCLSMSAALLAGCGSTASDTASTQSAAESASVSESSQAATEEASADTSVSAETETAADSEVSYPITITHAFGETVIEEKPERIVTLGWENQDTPLALGVVPVGCSAANYGKVTDKNLHTWTDAAFAALGEDNPVVFDDTDGFDYEAINDAAPDVILAAYSGMTEEEYNLLSEIAPVVTYQTAPWQTTWREQTILNAEGMGMKPEGEAKVAEVDALIQEKLAQYPELAGTKTAFLWISPDDFSTFYAYLPTDPRANFLLDLGLEVPQSILDLAENADDFSVTISRENADTLSDVEMIIVYGDEELLTALQADPLMSSIPAIKNGAVMLLDATTDMAAATTPSILSIPACIDEYLSLLNAAHENIQ
ncbi:MAG: iron-siderophore ABC transporter substrate-binding protein [Eubacteriales bacterium]|nr:iron-siderophore ABC transporter substrate-binding protein [Eubacteriales bacterium]